MTTMTITARAANTRKILGRRVQGRAQVETQRRVPRKRKCPGYRSGYDYGYAQPAMVPMIPANPAIIISAPPIVIRP